MKQADVMGWGLMTRPPVQYVYGQRPDDGKRTPEDLSSGEVADFRMRHPEVVTSSPTIVRCLAWLEQFAPPTASVGNSFPALARGSAALFS